MGRKQTGKRREKGAVNPEAIQQRKSSVAVRLRNAVKVNTRSLN